MLGSLFLLIIDLKYNMFVSTQSLFKYTSSSHAQYWLQVYAGRFFFLCLWLFFFFVLVSFLNCRVERGHSLILKLPSTWGIRIAKEQK